LGDFFMNTRRMTLLLAVLLAIGTGWLTLNYVNNVKRSEFANNGAPQNVVVAAVDIPARTTITAAMLQQRTLPGSAVERDAIQQPSQAAGQLSLITIPAGSQVTLSKVGNPAETALPVRLAPGKRAVSIQIDKVKGISGMLQPGDRVDIIAIPPRSGNELPQAAAILRGIRVLAVGSTLENASATPSPEEASSTTVTLEVTPHQADLLASADANTQLRLALRSPREPLNSEPTESLQIPVTQVAAAPAPAQQPQPAPAAPAPALQPQQQRPAQPQHGNIMIIDGDHVNWSQPSSGNPQ
jgi:pilus assembly protein CpaB